MIYSVFRKYSWFFYSFLCCAEVWNWECATNVLLIILKNLHPGFNLSVVSAKCLSVIVVIKNNCKRKTEHFLNLQWDASEVWENTLVCDTNKRIKNVKGCTNQKSLVSYGAACTRAVKQEDRLKHHWPISPNKTHVTNMFHTDIRTKTGPEWRLQCWLSEMHGTKTVRVRHRAGHTLFWFNHQCRARPPTDYSFWK